MKHAEKICKLTRRQKADLLTGRDFWTTHGIEEIGLPQAWLADGPSGVRKQVAASDHLGLNPSLAATCLPSSAKEETNLILCRQAIRGVHFRQVQYTKQ